MPKDFLKIVKSVLTKLSIVDRLMLSTRNRQKEVFEWEIFD